MAEPADSLDGPGSLRRACDQCRTRKIRCDKETPCSNCRTAQRKCSSTGLGQKPKEARQRVLISHQYERKIDHFEARLAGIEEMLRSLTTSLSRGEVAAPVNPRPYTSPSVAESSTVYEDVQSTDEDDDQAFEGNSSMTAHTVFASEFLEHAVTSTSLGRQLSPDIKSALSSLQQLVRMQNQKGSSHESKFTHQKPMPKGGVKELPLPPTQIVVQLLREIKDTPPATFALTCAFIAIEDFIESCRKVYFATEDYSLAIFIIVNCGLYYLFQEKSVMNEQMRTEFLEYHYLCRDNLETALSNLPLLMPARMDMIEALMLGATYAIEISKFTLAWQFNNAAAMMCQTLGWHRMPTTHDETTDKKTAIFWFSYMLDKGLSLRFGRASLLQDWDIAVPRHFGKVNMTEPWKNVLNLWISHSGIMGQAYEQLYSPAALARSPAQRTESARLLIESMERSWRTADKTMDEIRNEHAVTFKQTPREMEDLEWRTMTLEMILKSDQVSYWATMTLLYRAIPGPSGVPSTFNTECIEAARMAFQYHQECMELTSTSLFVKAGYLHWTILYSPFIPFIVLFCHVIETSNTEDLERLAQFVTMLQPAITMSAAIEKLHRLCQILYKVAALYVEAKAQQQQDDDMGMVGNDFDMYLTQLGFMPQQAATGENMSEGGEFTDMTRANANQTTQLGDWFSSNNRIMGLLEEDLSGFNPGVWSSMMGPQ